MAIDSAEKRRSVSGIPFPIGPGVTPDASKDAGWRFQSGWGYSGIAVDAPGSGDIDTAEKRRSVGGLVFPLGPGVTPNSDKDAEWRAQSAWSYSGNVVTSEAAAGGGNLGFLEEDTVRRKKDGVRDDLLIAMGDKVPTYIHEPIIEETIGKKRKVYDETDDIETILWLDN